MTPAQVAHIMALVNRLVGLAEESADYEEIRDARAATEAALRDAPQAEPNMTLDGLTPQQFALRELYEFQEATGCDTAEQFLAMPWDVLRDRMLAATPSAPTAVEP